MIAVDNLFFVSEIILNSVCYFRDFFNYGVRSRSQIQKLLTFNSGLDLFSSNTLVPYFIGRPNLN